MNQQETLAARLRRIGFRCVRCGSCCREVSPGSNIVMIAPEEIRAIARLSGTCRDDIADPFPDAIRYSDGSRVTFEWCLKRKDGTCVFADGVRCSVYRNRPWICRTFPFAWDGSELSVSDCPGIGLPMDEGESLQLAGDLILRFLEETKENERIRDLLDTGNIPDADLVVIDGEGVTVITNRTR